MSKYQPRKIFINDPEKNVPENIVEQFFLTIKSGDIDKIREFANQYKNKYNLIEKASKGSGGDFGKTPYHVVLEIDDKIADTDAKLRIMEFLNEMKAPMELPNSADVWPIHLAALSQSTKIVDFFIKHGVVVNRRDSSNNTPLHYAITGKEVNCPKAASIGDLTDAKKIDKLELNTTLEDASVQIMKIMRDEQRIKDDIIHIINTIYQLPQMYAGDKYAKDLETEIIGVFTDIALNPNYSSTSGQTGNTMTQTNKLKQIIDNTYSKISDDWKNLIKPLSIGPNKQGWGPTMTVGEPIKDIDRIFDSEIGDLNKEARDEYVELRNNIMSREKIRVANFVKDTTIVKEMDKDYIRTLIFESDHGEDVALTKMMYLLMWDYWLKQYPEDFMERIMANFTLTTDPQNNYIMNHNYNNFNPATLGLNSGNALFRASILHIYTQYQTIADSITSRQYGIDQLLRNAFDILNRASFLSVNDLFPVNNCISNRLEFMFTHKDRAGAINALDNELTGQTLVNLVTDTKKPYTILQPDMEKIPLLVIGTRSWPELFDFLIKRMQPQVSAGGAARNYFINASSEWGFYIIRLDKSGGTNDPDQPGILYTYYELFRYFDMIETYLRTGRYSRAQRLTFLNQPFSNWYNYVDSISALRNTLAPNTVAVDFPEYIFLYKILIAKTLNQIRTVVSSCITDAINIIKTQDLTIPVITALSAADRSTLAQAKYMMNLFNDAYILNLLLPPYPSNTTVFNKYMDRTWDKNSLTLWFEKFINTHKETIIDIVEKLKGQIYNLTNNAFSSFRRRNVLRILIRRDSVLTDTNKVINLNDFRPEVKKFLGTLTLIQAFTELLPTVTLTPINFKKITDANLILLRADPVRITQLFFLTEYYTMLFFLLRNEFTIFMTTLTTINTIINDIILFIRNRTFYYIPQIFLPALIKQLIISLASLVTIQTTATDNLSQKEDFYSLIDLTVPQHVKIMKLGDDFITWLNTNLRNDVYKIITDTVNYHNNVIDYLNYHSAFRMMIPRAKPPTTPATVDLDNFFIINLLPIDPFPNSITDETDMDELLKNFRTYEIPRSTHGNHYFNEGVIEESRTAFGVFLPRPIVTPIIGAAYLFDQYRNVIKYDRLNGNPVSQLDVTAVNTAGKPVYTVAYSNVSILGPWLDVSPKTIPMNATNIVYDRAYIANHLGPFPIPWVRGMFPSIRNMADKYFRKIKQLIVQKVIQHIVANKDTDPIKQMYNDIGLLGTDPDYSVTNNVRINVVVGKVADSLLNNLFEYTIRQTISEWLLKMVEPMPEFKKSNIYEAFNFIKEQDYSKLSFKVASKESAKQLINNSKYLDYKLSQIEPNPNNLDFSTKPINSEFIHYLYNINYFSTSNLTTNKKCYHTNPKIVNRFINSDSINSKNSDGNTPLHLAVLSNNYGLVSDLISRGAKPIGFTDIHGLSPYNIAIQNANLHFNFVYGNKVIDTITNFSTPFNDLMLARLKDEKYKNNIIKHITFGIPIELIAYNHMFNIYLENYRFGFSLELKEAVQKLVKKYNNRDLLIYPFDLFDTDSMNDLVRIIEPDDPENRIRSKSTMTDEKQRRMYDDKIEHIETKINTYKAGINGVIPEKDIFNLETQLAQLKAERSRIKSQDQLRIDALQRQIDTIKIQIKGLESEVVGPGQKILNDNLKLQLEAKVKDVNDKINLLIDKPESNYKEDVLVMYIATLKSIKQNAIDRNMEIIDFYNMGFGAINKNNELNISIWDNYINKSLESAPSMILSILSGIAIRIIRSFDDKVNKGDENVKYTELETITNFFSVVKAYIDSKASMPNNYTDNIVLKEEFSHIVYLINLIISPAIYNILLAYVYQGLQEMDVDNTVIINQNATLDHITDVTYNGVTLEKFVKGVLPKIAIKYYTTVYDSDRDNDRKLTSANDIFNPIIQIIKANKLIRLTDDSIVIKNIRDYLIPFMSNTYQNFIYHIQLAIYGYERYLLNTWQILKIVEIMYLNKPKNNIVRRI